MADSVLKIGPESPKENRLGLKATDYSGGKSTMFVTVPSSSR